MSIKDIDATLAEQFTHAPSSRLEAIIALAAAELRRRVESDAPRLTALAGDGGWGQPDGATA